MTTDIEAIKAAERIRQKQREDFFDIIDALGEDTRNRVLDLIDEWDAKYQRAYGLPQYISLPRATDFVEDNILMFLLGKE